jgi:alpha-L-rhamnosidase
MKKLIFAVAACALYVVSTSAQLPPEARKGLWHAQWITAPDTSQRDAVVLHFRKFIDLERVPEHFVLYVSADNQFLLCANQREVGRGPARSDVAHWNYETYDLAPFLHAGRNELAATVWNFGVSTPVAQISDRTGFVVRGDGEAERAVDTDASWEVQEEKGIGILPGSAELQRYYYVAEPGERIDGELYDWFWNDAARSRGKWVRAVSVGNAIERGAVLQNINWQLVADSLPPMQMEVQPIGRVVRSSGTELSGEFPGAGVEVPPHTTVSLLLDHTKLTTAFPELTVSRGAKSAIHLTYAEALVDSKGEKGNRNEIAEKRILGIKDEFLPDGSQGRKFMPLGWRTWRYLQLDIKTEDEPLRVEGLRSWFTAYPFEEKGRFESDDPSLAKIWEIGWRTARLDAHDTYMDTSYWERLQYIGDTRIQALISYTVSGDDRLARQAIRAFNDSRIADGITRSRYPSSVTQVIPTFSLLWIGMVHDFWRYRGDEEFVKLQIAGTRTVMDWFLSRQRADGLVGNISWWPFVDWGKDFSFGVPSQDESGGSSIITLQFIEALRYGAELESSFGDSTRAQRYREARARAVEAVRKLCWNQGNGLIADTPAQKHYSQHANILGVWLDVIPQERQREVLTKILSVSEEGFRSMGTVPEMTKATYYFRFYLARAVEHAGMGDRYLDLLRPWREMVGLGLTTWAEQPEPSRSDSHAWSAHPNFDFLTIVAGIRPKTPGSSTVRIEPHLGPLHHVTAAMPIPKGLVEVTYDVDGSSLHAAVTLPPGVTGEFAWKGKSHSLRAGRQELALP